MLYILMGVILQIAAFVMDLVADTQASNLEILKFSLIVVLIRAL